ncbi:MAG: AbrB/MazE/SpoVT family DNA-binding domain-containing protein [Chloroflexota bacterium]
MSSNQYIVQENGQVTLPKELRQEYRIRKGIRSYLSVRPKAG